LPRRNCIFHANWTNSFLTLIAIAALASSSVRIHAQAALLMEEPYGFFGALNPTGHNAIYFERVCAETPIRLRRCIFPDAGMTTPKQIAWKLERYARKHPESELTVFEIPRCPAIAITAAPTRA
jgi:hypothetical protein